jgi:mRNA interferase MazF
MGHTKVAVSLPNELFEQLVEAAREEATTRSALVAHALQNYFERKSAAEIVARLNQVYSGPWTEEEDREEQSLARMLRRPWLVIQSNLINASAINTVLACPLTSNLRHGHAIGNVTLEPGEAGLAIPSVVQVLGLTALNRSELSDYIGQVSARRVTQVVRGIVSVIQPREP